MRPAIIFPGLLILSLVLSSGCTYTRYEPEDRPDMEWDEPSFSNRSLPPGNMSGSGGDHEEPGEGMIIFRFSESGKECPLEGKVYLNDHYIGGSEEGEFKVSEYFFLEYGLEGENRVCLQGNLPEEFPEYEGWVFSRCWTVNLSESVLFSENNVATFEASINPRRPKSYPEQTNFIRPDLVNDTVERWKEIELFTGYHDYDLEIIWNTLNSHVRYRDDQTIFETDDYWKLPDETFDSQWGDCEDWTNAFVSLARAYDPGIRCFSVGLLTHLTAFCKLDTGNEAYYSFYDQYTRSEKTLLGNQQEVTEEKKKEMERLLNSYLELYGIGHDNREVIVAFNQSDYFPFGENEDFYEWALLL